MRYRVKLVDRLPRSDLGGLNCYAARDLGLPYPHRCSVVAVLRGQGARLTRETARHEVMEAEIMRTTKMPYGKAHRLVTRLEKMV